MKTTLLFDFQVNKENSTVLVKREFNASLELVWDAWTNPEILDLWWAPKPYKTRTKSMDFREGGTWLYEMYNTANEEQNECHWCKNDYQKIEQVADQISTMASNIAQMSNSLVTAAARASFLEDSLVKVCDVDLVYDTALLKVDLLNTKDKVYGKLGNYKSFKIEENTSLKQWSEKHINSGKRVDMTIMKNIDELNTKFHLNLQELVNANSNKEKNEELNKKAKEVEMEALRIFGNLNNVKREACKKK